jgi:murein DD-endopeptidase MepM/ murein hydrolase activator NlpD
MADTPLAPFALNAARPLQSRATPSEERARVAQLAQEFEATLMLQMIRQMRQSLLDEEQSSQGLGGSTMQDTFDVELSRHMATAGGVGLGTFLAAQLEARTASSGPAAAPAGEPRPLAPAVTSLPVGASSAGSAHLSEVRQPAVQPGRQADSAEGEAALRMPLADAMSSRFGWRADPFTGRSRFHSGVDLRAAYGTEVPAAAGGTVVFAGERGAYGNLVIVRHEDGVETRYGHLSTMAVRAGETIAPGAPIGRVGSTGRSTAPHLHFEVLVNGARVDPATMAGRIGRGPLKPAEGADD